MALEAFRRRPAPLPFPPPLPPTPPRPQPARHQSDKRYTHTCIRIRFLFNPLHIATPARPNPVVDLHKFHRPLARSPAPAHTNSALLLHPATCADKADLRQRILQRRRWSFFCQSELRFTVSLYAIYATGTAASKLISRSCF